MSILDQIYDLPPGAMVEIQLKETSLRGEFSVLPHGTSRNMELDQVQLERPIELPTGKMRNGTVSFPVRDIINLNVIEFGIFKKKRDYEDVISPSPQSSQGKSSRISNGGVKGGVISKKSKLKDQELKDLEPVEVILRTYVIRDEPKLKLLMKLLKEVDVCGITFEGQNIGRHGVLAWIVLTAGKTLIPIDIDSLSEKIPNLWQMLERDLLKNAKLIKIMHDSRAAADYLYHAHGIEMVNIFDTQVADAIVSHDRNNSAPQQLNSLSDALQIHNRRIPIEEIEFLRRFEMEDFSTNSPMLKKPIPSPEYLKLCALKVKHLVPLRENLVKEMMKKLTECTKAHMDSYRMKSKESYSKMTKDTRHISEELISKIEDDLGQLII
jgi:hypothetical protein